MRSVACLFALVLMFGLCGAMRAADEESWGGDEAKTKDLRLTLKSGEVVQGRYSADTKDKVMLSVVSAKGKNSQSVKKDDVAKREWVKPYE
ncbi:MAG TPA: hypothetical protein VL860_06085, partial [Planctomycetota bacterium]|nr:hypothetical protein [Planctomycetota bacterium]